jgi:putative ABC transport system permease protein
MRFMRDRDLGMNLEQLIVIDGPEVLDDETSGGEENMSRAFAFKQEASRLPFVKMIAGSQHIPGEWYNFTTAGIKRPTGQKDDEKKRYNFLMTDDKFFSTYQMTFVAGKNFTLADNLGDFKFRNVVVNEAAALQLGFKSASEAVGQLVQWGDPSDGKGQQFQVGGVLKNYHHKSLKDAIAPIIFLPSEATRRFTLRISMDQSMDNVQRNLSTLEQLYKKILPGNPFVVRFADDIFQKQYEDERRIGDVFGLFGSLALVIACLGLFGLAAFAAESRTKEIGVRKVLGASEASIVGLLSKDFLKLVGIAFVIGTPFAFWLMNAWLQDFAYHVELRSGFGVGVFVVAGLLAASVAFITVAGQAWKAARANAVESLRYE